MAKEEGADRRLVGFEFFEVLLPGGSRSKLRLPYKFAVELQKQGKISHAKLRTPRGGRLWDVRVGGSGIALCLADGWEEFAKAHDLQYTVLFLLFRYDGDAVFTVKVFDESECPRDDFLAVGGGGGDGGSSTAGMPGGPNSQFAETLRPCNVTDKYLNVPLRFQEEHGYAEKTQLVLQLGGRSWTVGLKHRRGKGGGTRTSVRSWWKRFQRENNLEVGDTCFFQALGDGDGDGRGHVLKVEVRKKDGSYVA